MIAMAGAHDDPQQSMCQFWRPDRGRKLVRVPFLILRPGERVVFNEQGDFDGQVRTIIDALRMPDNPSETGGAQPEEDERPLFCLLQNDKLISEIKVTADELLQLPEQAFNPSEREQAVLRFNQMLYGQSMPAEDRAALELARKTLQRRGDVRPHDASIVVHVRLNHRDARTFDKLSWELKWTKKGIVESTILLPKLLTAKIAEKDRQGRKETQIKATTTAASPLT
jgi:hypothetical protein